MNRLSKSALAVALLGAMFCWPTAAAAQNKSSSAKSTKPAASASAVVAPVKSVGSKSAPILMEVFSDFQCPSCRQLYFEAMQPLLNDYVYPGKVYYVHRDVPLPMHKYSQHAARYANAAASIGKFEVVARVLYASQDQWGAPGAENLSKLDAAVASVLTPAEMNRVRQLMNTPAIQAAIDKDVALGRLNRVTGTPTVILTHRGQTYPLPGGVTYPLLRRVLDQLLAQ